MRIPLEIDARVMALLEQEAARAGRSVSELVEMALRLYLRPATSNAELPPLPKFECGGLVVDSSNRDEFRRALDGY